MGFLMIIICAIAAYRLYGHSLFIIALIITILDFWSYGIMHNYRRNPDMIPNFWVSINMISSIGGIGLLIFSFFI